MEIFGTKKNNKSLQLQGIDIMLTIDEIDSLIAFLEASKKHFIERQKNRFVAKLIKKNDEYCAENISSYVAIVESGHEIIEDHLHYRDWLSRDVTVPLDIVLHTNFIAIKSDNGGITWKNENRNSNGK